MYLTVAVNLHLYQTLEYSTDDSSSNSLGFFFENNKEENYGSYVGKRVLVDVSNHKVLGVVVSESQGTQNKNLKRIISVLDKKAVFDESLMSLISWAVSYYHYPIGEAFFSALPQVLKKAEVYELPSIEGWSLINPHFESEPNKGGLGKKAKEAISLLSVNDLSTTTLRDCGVDRQVLLRLEKKGILQRKNFRDIFNNWYSKPLEFKHSFVMNSEQENAVNAVCSNNGYGAFLLYGVTGSGKTEVYLQIIERYLKAGKQALVLIPEINLTPQTVKRFYERFSVPVVTMHSSMNAKERFESYNSIGRKEAAILIGTRSAIFAPIPNLGIIIIDEEHDNSYRQEDGFRYHARDLAVMLAYNRGIPIVMGTATPSLETLYNVNIGKYKLLSLKHRTAGAEMATIEPVNLCKDNVQHGISFSLLMAIKNEVSQGNQVIIMLNRRGYAPQLICNDCGYVFRCQNCDVNLCYHRSSNHLICHHCETKYPIPNICPECHSTNLAPTGNGTEQIYEYLLKMFPNEKIIRVDRDTTSRKGELENILQDISNCEYKIIVGTQMLAKGHDFPNVTLVGIVDVDSYLYSNDYRAYEKLAQLVIQVSGRAGRGAKKGRVILQTHKPEHPLLKELIDKGYSDFADNELERRKSCQLHPYTNEAVIRADSLSLESVTVLMQDIYAFLKTLAPKYLGVTFSTPVSSFIERKENKYHLNIILESNSRNEISRFIDEIINNKKNFRKVSQCHMVVEVDPTTLL